jgi:desulfoferrodoxin (superoxide reductase-like protein)
MELIWHCAVMQMGPSSSELDGRVRWFKPNHVPELYISEAQSVSTIRVLVGLNIEHWFTSTTSRCWARQDFTEISCRETFAKHLRQTGVYVSDKLIHQSTQRHIQEDRNHITIHIEQIRVLGTEHVTRQLCRTSCRLRLTRYIDL